MEAANGGYPPQQQQQQEEAPYRIRPSRPIRNPYAAHYYYASQQRQQQQQEPQQQQYGDYSHQVVEQPFPHAVGTYQDDEHHHYYYYDNNHSPSPSSSSGIIYKEQDYHQPQPNGPTYDQHHQEATHPFPSQEGPRPPFQGRRRPPYLSGSSSWKIPSSSDLEPSLSSFGMAAVPSPPMDGYGNAGTGDSGAITPAAAADMFPMLEPALQSSSSMNGFMTLDSTSNKNWRRDRQYHHDDDDPYYYHHQPSPTPPAAAMFDRRPSSSSVYNVGFDDNPLSTSAIPNSNNDGGGEQNDDMFNNNGYHNNAVLN
eukprot:scaffold4397_cov96-Cylindrotheca_fusiformis.AAC.1